MTMLPHGVFLLAAVVTWTVANDQDNSLFEAAFQGQCGHGSPCEQLCYELHDGMFECDCKEGFYLHDDGYSCLEMNTTMETLLDPEEDILYQKDASFSAELDLSASSDVVITSPPNAVQFVTSPSPGVAERSASAAAAEDEEGDGRTTEGLSVCTMECGQGGVCTIEAGRQRCQCPLGRGGPRCDEEVEVISPRFTGQSWLAFPALRAAYKHVQLSLEFRPESWDGVLFLTGERDDMAGDFMALLLHKGFVEFRFDCGSGVGVVRSEQTVLLNQWNHVTLYRHRWDAWIQLNDGKHVEGRSKGLFSRITFREPLFLGGPGNTTGLTGKLPIEDGLRGCVRRLEVNDHVYSFSATPLGDASKGFDVEECSADRCSKEPCQHGGKCLTTEETAVCLCPLGFTGDLCETRVDLQVPSFNGSSYLRYPGLGYTALSWLDMQLILKPANKDGVILYNGRRSDGVGDFMAVYISEGHIEFTFDLGTGTATIRSIEPVSLGEWHDIRISRTGRLASLQVDDSPPVQTLAPGAFTQLSLPHNLYIGGVPNYDMVSPKVRVRASFEGCVQKVTINNEPLQIVSAALGGVNVNNCPHPCVARPCGELSRCLPERDHYSCACYREGQCEQQASSPARFLGDSFLHYTDTDTIRRIVSYKVNINMRFRTNSASGLLLWSGRRDAASDFLSLGVVDGLIHFRFDLGSGEVDIIYNQTRVDDGLWHRVKATRNEQVGSVIVDSGTAYQLRSPGRLRQLNTNTGLYIGGMDDSRKQAGYSHGMIGCISDLTLDTDYHVHLLQMATSTRNVDRCG